MSVCPDIGVRDFPIINDVPVSTSLNESIADSFLIDLQWGTRSTPPEFRPTNDGTLDEGKYGQQSQSSTLRLQGNTYRLLEVRIVKPIHTSFLLPDFKNTNLGEVIMIFENSSAEIGTPYIFLCIPLISIPDKYTGTITPVPPYLQAIRLGRLSGKPVSLGGFFTSPSHREFVTYATCLAQVKDKKTVAANTQVFVFINGIMDTNANLKELMNKWKRSPGTNRTEKSTEFADLALPANLMKQANNMQPLFRISNEVNYKTYLRSSKLTTATVEKRIEVAPGLRVDDTSSYKCVPLSPDQNVKDGRILVNTDEGTLLSQVLAEKKVDDEIPEDGLTPGDVERFIANVVGILIGLFFLSVIAYTITTFTSSNAAPAFPYIRSLYGNVAPSTFIAVAVGTIGFLIGYFLS